MPLAQRRRVLQGRRAEEHRDAGGDSAVHEAPRPAVHLPEGVLAAILRAACASGGAIPIVPIASCVCRAWRSAVLASPDLWEHVDLGHGWCRPSDAGVAAMLPRWRATRRLSMSGCLALTDAALEAVAAGCPALESLDLSHCAGFTERGMCSALGAMLLRPAGPGSSPLRRVNLSFIRLSPVMSALDQVVRELLAVQALNPVGPVLQELILEGCPLLTHHGLRAVADASVKQRRPVLGALLVLDLSQSAGARNDFVLLIERWQYACPELRELRLNGLCGAYAWSYPQTPSTLPPGAQAGFPQLRVCQVAAKSHATMVGLGTGATNVNDACLTRLLARSPLLEHLDIGGCERLSPNCLALAVHPAAPLVQLLMPRSSACCDEAVVFVADRFRDSLEAIDLSWGAGRITDAAAQALAGCPRLHAVGLAGTAVTTAGVRALFAAAAQRGRLDRLTVDVGSCRGLERGVRQAASQGMAQLRAALGY